MGPNSPYPPNFWCSSEYVVKIDQKHDFHLFLKKVKNRFFRNFLKILWKHLKKIFRAKYKVWLGPVTKKMLGRTSKIGRDLIKYPLPCYIFCKFGPKKGQKQLILSKIFFPQHTVQKIFFERPVVVVYVFFICFCCTNEYKNRNGITCH